MVKVKTKTSAPVVESIKIVLSPDEAKLLMAFLGTTSIRTVEELMPYHTAETRDQTNDVLYDVYNGLYQAFGSVDEF